MFSGVFEWESNKFNMSGNVVCYGMRLYDDPKSSGSDSNITLSSVFFDFDNNQMIYSLQNSYKFLAQNPYYNVVYAKGVIKNDN
jgi:hypothetical protein